jgi:hypothetical protein
VGVALATLPASTPCNGVHWGSSKIRLPLVGISYYDILY